MSDKRIKVWLQKPANRSWYLEWRQPGTRRRRSMTIETTDEKLAERARADKEYELNHGLHRDDECLQWQRFCAIYETDKLQGGDEETRKKALRVLRAFDAVVKPASVQVVDER